MAIFMVDAPHNFTTNVLSQFAGARTEPFTGFVSFVLCKEFKISIRGQRNMNNALNNLPVYGTPDERLTFGWAMQSLSRSRAVHEGAYENLAIMIALSESFHESYAARVMFEMAQARAGDRDITPHFGQWKQVIHSLNGAFASADFGVLVEDYIRLGPYHISYALDDNFGNFPVNPKDVGKALRALAPVTTGEQKQVTLLGGAICAWFAALSEWFYDLRIALFSKDGKQLHVSHPGQETQVLLVFYEKPCLEVSTKPWTGDDKKATEGLILQSYSGGIHKTPFSGRVVWQSLLPRVFGRSFHHLDHEESKTLGTLIGSAARMFQGLALDEGKETHTDLLSAQNRANTSSYGPGLIQTLTNWLPELRRFQGRMERALKLNWEDASKSYVENLVRLRKVCHCGICKSKEEVDEKTDGVPPEHGYCLTTLAETIIAAGLALSRITVSSNTFPSRAGMQSFYSGQVAKRMEARGRHWTEHFTIVYGNEWNASDARRLQNCVQIFSGSRPPNNAPENLVALSHEGICAYFVSLERSGAKHHYEAVKLIRIVSGGINIRHKVFNQACLGPVKDEGLDDPWEEVIVEHLPEPLYCK